MRRVLFFLLLIISLRARSQVFSNPPEAFALSKQSGKPVMLIFSGSDWCVPCIQFNKRILNDSSFLRFAANKLILLEADFPQRKKIPSDLKTAYESLADKYNPNGEFPKIVLLDITSTLITDLPYLQQSPDEFINEIKKKLN